MPTGCARCRNRPSPTTAFGTTSTFEGHGIANEVLRVYKQAHHDGTLTMRSTLAFSANWPAAGGAPLGPFVEAWAGWLGEPGLGDDMLKMGGLYVQVGRGPADEVRARPAPTPAGPASTPATACRPTASRNCCWSAPETTSARWPSPAAAGLACSTIYEEVDKQIPLKGRRWVVSHVNVISPRDIERIVGWASC